MSQETSWEESVAESANAQYYQSCIDAADGINGTEYSEYIRSLKLFSSERSQVNQMSGNYQPNLQSSLSRQRATINKSILHQTYSIMEDRLSAIEKENGILRLHLGKNSSADRSDG